jgi:hypothetical protein
MIYYKPGFSALSSGMVNHALAAKLAVLPSFVQLLFLRVEAVGSEADNGTRHKNSVHQLGS